MRAVIFDLDGTLFQTEKVGVPAFHETFSFLRERGLCSGDPPSDERIASVFGMTHEEIWEALLPGADEQTRKLADRIMLEKEVEMLRQGRGMLYPGVRETLHKLHEAGFTLFIASNGVSPYVCAALESKDLTPLFSGIYTAGDHETRTKADLVRILKEMHGVGRGYMVGDRKSDVQAGRANDLVVIGCRYAGFPQFGAEDELDGSDWVIGNFAEILDIVV
jgi:phosphoglycolate phosphatase